jgi:hypothetical protein
MAAIPEFIAALITAEPMLATVHAEHLADNDELLPHLFMADVTRWLAANGPSSKVIQTLETYLERGDADVRNVIEVSFLENLERDDPTHQRIRAALAPRLRASLAAMEAWTPWDLDRPTYRDA